MMQHHRSPFLNLGLWTACFHRFRHPKVQYDELYTGCHPVWGERLQMIAYWLVPGEMLEKRTFAKFKVPQSRRKQKAPTFGGFSV